MDKLVLDAHEQYRVDRKRSANSCYMMIATYMVCHGDPFCERIMNHLAYSGYYRARETFISCPCCNFSRAAINEFIKVHKTEL